MTPEEHQLIQKALDNMFQGRESITLSRARAENILTTLAHEVEKCAGHKTLLSLRTVEQVADATGITPRGVRKKAKMLKDRGVVGFKVGKHWLFLESEIEHFNRDHRLK